MEDTCNQIPLLKDILHNRVVLRNILIAGAICFIFYYGSAFVAFDTQKTLDKPLVTDRLRNAIVSEASSLKTEPLHDLQEKKTGAASNLYHSESEVSSDGCKASVRRFGTENLPDGIVKETSNLEMESLWDSPQIKEQAKGVKSLLAIPVGIRQKDIVEKIIEKFPSANFTLMLFHYDGIVDGWKNLSWSDRALHVSAMSQTKWWFAKRFLHPDIVADYEYIFLWDEDLGVENFHPLRYIDIVKSEKLEISQPALGHKVFHYPITARQRHRKVHRRADNLKSGKCNATSKAPPCAGWVEMMAPVFSRAAWRCVWHMIQNDLVYGWGLDYKLGYCAQGDRTLNVGVVDSEYILHKHIPTLGGGRNDSSKVSSKSASDDKRRLKVRQRSYDEMMIFKTRWDDAAKNDKCWADPYAAVK